MPLYIAKSGNLEGCHACLTDWLTHSHLKDRATQRLIKYKSGALVTQFILFPIWMKKFWKANFDCMEVKSEIFETFANLKSVPYRHLPIPSEITHKLLFTWDDHLSSLQGARYLQYIFYFHFSKIYFQWISSHSYQLCHQNPQNNFLFLVLFSSHNLYSTTIWSTAFAVVEVVKH